MRLPLLVATLLLLAIALPASAAAHEQRDVADGRYSMEVGFRDEPAYLGQPNALFLKVTKFGAGGGAVDGLAGSLEAEAQKGQASPPGR